MTLMKEFLQSDFIRKLKKDLLAIAGFSLLILFLLLAVFADFVSPHDPQAQELANQLRPPFWNAKGTVEHPLGTDELGRDILSNIIFGLRVSLAVGFLAAIIALILGVVTGLLAGYFGGRLDTIIMRTADMQLSIPAILIAMVVLALWGRGVDKIIILLGVVNWSQFARIVRGSAVSVRENEYVEAARALGMGHFKIITRHVLPNVLTPLLVVTAVMIPRFILIEATLSFLGVGVPLTTPSLGLSIARGQEVLTSGYWWLSVLPGLALMMLVLGLNLVGDWLRDVLDPRMQA